MKKNLMEIRLKKVLFYNLKGLFAIAFISNMLMMGINLILSYLLQVITDVAAGVDKSLTLTDTVIMVVAAILMLGVFGIICTHSQNSFKKKAMEQYKNTVFDRITLKGIGAFRNEVTTQYMSGITNDATVIENNYLMGIINIGVQIFMFIGSLAMMLWYSPVLTLVAIGLSLLPVIASACTAKSLTGLEKNVSDKNDDFLSVIKEALSGFSVVKSFKAEKKVAELVHEADENLEAAKKRKNIKTFVISLIGSGAGAVTQFGVLIVGGWMCFNGNGITPGMLFVFANLMNFVIQPIASLPGLLAGKKAAEGLIHKMEEALEEEHETAGEGKVCTITDSVRLKNLSFSYEEGKKVLDDISYEFEAGKSYAVVGASGCGKSTLLQLMLSGLEGYEGSIYYDGSELSDISRESLYDAVSTVQQNVFVFNSSIRDNITMFRDFSGEAVDRVIRLAGLSDLIKEKGEDYMCGENGSGLSGGEKQRISIARALLKKAKLLLVDEATAALDAETSNHVINSILGIDEMTKIIITHDLDEGTLKKYDSILALKNGKIVENGSFEQLMKDKGYFYSLFTVSQ